MMVQLPKVRRDGKYIDTVIDASEIKGLEPKTFMFQGSQINGTKVYANGGNFWCTASPAMIAQAKCQALATGQMIALEAPQVKVVQGAMKVMGQLGQGKKEWQIPQYGSADWKALKSG